MRIYTSIVFLSSLTLLACSGSDGKNGKAGTSCTVEEDNGEVTISCDDGTSATVMDGADGNDGDTGDTGDSGTSCSVEDNGDGTKTISCDDGSEVTVTDGEDGGEGGQGPAGSSCSVEDNGDGTSTITCEDGTEATLSDGAMGTSCTIVSNGTGSATITCGDDSAVVYAKAVPAISFATYGYLDYYYDDVTGYRFTVGDNPITVTDLGYYDADLDGLAETHDVGIYEVSSEALVASATLPVGADTVLDGPHRYIPVTPVELAANTTYVVLGYRATNADAIAGDCVGITTSGALTYDTEIATNGTGALVFHNAPFGYPSNCWQGANFRHIP